MRTTQKGEKVMTLVPAYGRDYKSGKAVKEAWAEGKDFIIADMFSGNDGRAINKADCKSGEIHMVRYKALTQLVQVKA
jgi:hypothetical protein